MADADFDGFGGGFSTTGHGSAEGLQRYINMAGALSSVALVIGLGFWGYKLAVRDVSGVPVVQALDGPMRIAPDNPGGEIADHQGLSVNEVAAAGTAAPPPERLILAPRPVELTVEDAAGLAGQPVPNAGPAVAMAAGPEPALAADPLAESPDPTELAVAAALAEALAEPVAVDPVANLMAPEGAIIRSLRPLPRPERAGSALAAAEAVALVPPTEVDPGTLVAGTRLVQFGAYDTADEARAEWTRLQSQFNDLMAEKAMVVQPAESSGRTFYRLRAHGFEDDDDARRFCSAFITENAACIPVAQR